MSFNKLILYTSSHFLSATDKRTDTIIIQFSSAGAVHRSEPAQSVRAMVGHLGNGRLHAFPLGGRTHARDPRMHQLKEAER